MSVWGRDDWFSQYLSPLFFPCTILSGDGRDKYFSGIQSNVDISSTIHLLLVGNYSCLRVRLIFNRDRAFYFTTVFIPDIILVTSSFITFWLEWNAVPARVMLGVTTMLNFFTTRWAFNFNVYLIYLPAMQLYRNYGYTKCRRVFMYSGSSKCQ